jgi:Ca2+-binding RTX toxin-like protein
VISSRGRPRTARIAALAGALGVLAVTAALAATVHHGARDVPRAQAVATGALAMSNSRDAQAIFSATDFAPGDSATGTVTITNTGTAAGSLALAPAPVQTSGARGRALLGALRLRIADVTAGADVYDGRLAELPALELSRLNAGDARTFRFSASLPDGGASADDAGDNLLQRASMSVAYGWTLTQTGEPPTANAPSAGLTPAGAPPGAPTINKPDRVAPLTFRSPRRTPCRRRLLGTARGNRLTGTAGGDLIYGRGGADRIHGLGGNDCVWGGTGNDRIWGGTGADQLHGGTGRDVISGNAGRDRIIAGLGADLVYARDGKQDWIDCGPGRDRAVVDRGDRVRHCERVLRPVRRR